MRAAYITDNWTAVDGGSGIGSEWTLVSGDTITPTRSVMLEKQVGDVRIERKEQKYKKLKKKGGYTVNGEGGWVGLTDKYWLQAAIAPQGISVEAEYDFKFINNADVYETSYTTTSLTITRSWYFGAHTRHQTIDVSALFQAICLTSQDEKSPA